MYLRGKHACYTDNTTYHGADTSPSVCQVYDTTLQQTHKKTPQNTKKTQKKTCFSWFFKHFLCKLFQKNALAFLFSVVITHHRITNDSKQRIVIYNYVSDTPWWHWCIHPASLSTMDEKHQKTAENTCIFSSFL